jgi:ribose/xylose/arabinose/galactoside ABC-type transport system permease subunit
MAPPPPVDGAPRWIGLGQFLGFPTPVWVMAAVTLLTWLMIRYTPIGRRVYAVGSNPHAAALSGLSVARVKIFTFALTGFLVAVATIITQQGKLNNAVGEGKELLVVTCIVVGGVSINGGIGTVLGVLLGALLLENQKTFLIFLNLGQGLSKWDKAIQGGLILIAVLIDHFALQRKRGQAAGGH